MFYFITKQCAVGPGTQLSVENSENSLSAAGAEIVNRGRRMRKKSETL